MKKVLKLLCFFLFCMSFVPIQTMHLTQTYSPGWLRSRKTAALITGGAIIGLATALNYHRCSSEEDQDRLIELKELIAASKNIANPLKSDIKQLKKNETELWQLRKTMLLNCLNYPLQFLGSKWQQLRGYWSNSKTKEFGEIRSEKKKPKN